MNVQQNVFTSFSANSILRFDLSRIYCNESNIKFFQNLLIHMLFATCPQIVEHDYVSYSHVLVYNEVP
jgi:hypothetical protein